MSKYIAVLEIEVDADYRSSKKRVSDELRAHAKRIVGHPHLMVRKATVISIKEVKVEGAKKRVRTPEALRKTKLEAAVYQINAELNSEKNTYHVYVKCTNCGHVPKIAEGCGEAVSGIVRKPITILRGTLVEDFLICQVCENCGCYCLVATDIY